jgi:hypothetical protein
MRPRRVGRHPSRLAEFIIGPATLGRTRWLAPQDDGRRLGRSRPRSATPGIFRYASSSTRGASGQRGGGVNQVRQGVRLTDEQRLDCPLFMNPIFPPNTNKLSHFSNPHSPKSCRTLLQPFSLCFKGLQRLAAIPCDMVATTSAASQRSNVAAMHDHARVVGRSARHGHDCCRRPAGREARPLPRTRGDSAAPARPVSDADLDDPGVSRLVALWAARGLLRAVALPHARPGDKRLARFVVVPVL